MQTSRAEIVAVRVVVEQPGGRRDRQASAQTGSPRNSSAASSRSRAAHPAQVVLVTEQPSNSNSSAF